MLPEEISDEENLYRRVILNPNFWDFDNGKPSSAVFKDSKGVSVDRQGARQENQIIQDFQNRFALRAILKVTAGTCRNKGTYPIYKPVEGNLYHAEIHESPTKITISSSKAKKLRDSSEIIFQIQ